MENIRIVNLQDVKCKNELKQISVVYEEADYSKFTTFRTNRKPDHVGRIKCNIINKGWITNPILVTNDPVNDKFVIIDGCNRFNSLKELQLPIPFIVLENATEDDMVALNIVQKNWVKIDYINFYASKGYEEYIKFLNIKNEYPDFTISTLEYVLKLSCEGEHRNSEKYAGRISLGNFKVKDIDRSREILNFCIDVRNGSAQGSEVFNQQNFVLTVMRLFRNKNFDPEIMLYKLNTNRTMIGRCNSCESYREMLEDIYNANRRGRSSCPRIHLDFILPTE